MHNELLQCFIRLMALLENTFSGLYGATPVGKALAVNPAYVKRLDDESEQELLDVETPSTPYFSRPEYEAFGEQSIAKEAIRDYMERLRKREGSEVTVTINMREVKVPDGTMSSRDLEHLANGVRKRYANR